MTIRPFLQVFTCSWAPTHEILTLGKIIRRRLMAVLCRRVSDLLAARRRYCKMPEPLPLTPQARMIKFINDSLMWIKQSNKRYLKSQTKTCRLQRRRCRSRPTSAPKVERLEGLEDHFCRLHKSEIEERTPTKTNERVSPELWLLEIVWYVLHGAPMIQ